MRILIADRNARLLEAIARTFARQFSIQTATRHERCNELLLQCEFDLVVISEKLADGPGLKLLAQIARDSPDTLRVFAARRPRLQLLKGKLGPFGLFRTLAYPIDPQELLCALTLARSGLEVDAPALETRKDPAPRARNVPAPTVASPAIERVSLTSADAVFAIDVPMTIASLAKVRRSNSPSAPRVMPVAPQANASRPQATASQARRVAQGSPGEARQSQQAVASHPPGIAPQFTAARPSLPRPTAPQPEAVRPAPPPRLLPQSQMFELVGERRETASRVVSGFSLWGSLRSKFVLAGTAVGVFLVTTLTLILFDAHVTRASTPRPEIARSAVPAPPPNSAPVLPRPFNPTPAVAHRVEPKRPMGQPKPVVPDPDEEPDDPQITASTSPPIADPSTFGSEAYEPIYSN
jgi:DNA-binding NarL/FixJ family response regulator